MLRPFCVPLKTGSDRRPETGALPGNPADRGEIVFPMWVNGEIFPENRNFVKYAEKKHF